MFFVIFGPKPERDWRYDVPDEASDAASAIWRLLAAMAVIAAVVTLLELTGTGEKRDDSLVATSPDPSSHAVGEELPK
jgi:ribosomal protein L4